MNNINYRIPDEPDDEGPFCIGCEHPIEAHDSGRTIEGEPICCECLINELELKIHELEELRLNDTTVRVS